jgi:hypothetical protein
VRAEETEATWLRRGEATKCSPEIGSEYETEATPLVVAPPQSYKVAGGYIATCATLAPTVQRVAP